MTENNSNSLIDVCKVCSTGNYPDYLSGKDLCKKHNVCVRCGIKRADLDHTPWFSRTGAFQCRPCEKARRESDVRERISKGFNHEYTDEVVCPHCGYTEGDSFEAVEGERECPDCEKAYIMERNIIVTYSTEKTGEDL